MTDGMAIKQTHATSMAHSLPAMVAGVGEVLAAADEKFGEAFAGVATTCRVWLNGEAAMATDPVGDDDEVALLPPVSGG